MLELKCFESKSELKRSFPGKNERKKERKKMMWECAKDLTTSHPKSRQEKSVHGDIITGYFILVSLSLLVGKDSTDGDAKNY